MKHASMKVLAPTVVLGVFLSLGAVRFDPWAPDDGDLVWWGDDTFDSILRWRDEPYYPLSHGFELDIQVRHDPIDERLMFSGCWSWTDLPTGYDDCPTAGVSDPPGYRVYSVGAFEGWRIEPDFWYYSFWGMSRGQVNYSEGVRPTAQLNRAECPYGGIWCRFSIDSENFGQQFKRIRLLIPESWRWGDPGGGTGEA